MKARVAIVASRRYNYDTGGIGGGGGLEGKFGFACLKIYQNT
jgi:hypothetical protein